jgi:hypothetical protein
MNYKLRGPLDFFKPKILFMKRMTLLAFATFTVATTTFAQFDSAATARWINYMTPGKEHRWLAESNGTWTGEVTMWMAPGTEPMKSTSTTTNTMILGGRYQQSSHKGNFMGQPFEGQSTLAYDNLKKVFISTWIDNMGTGMMIGEGPWDEKTKSVTIKGKMMDPMSGKECQFREVFKIVDKDHQVLEMYAPDAATGKEFKTMEIKYTRN